LYSNIDVRIQQAEAEFQLGREELVLLALTEEFRNLSGRLEETSPQLMQHAPATTLHRLESHKFMFGNNFQSATLLFF
jgi:hypothetical protein